MQKKLLSLAVAAAVTAPTAVLADATLYGRAHVSIDYFDIKSDVGERQFKGWALSKGPEGKGNSRASRIGLKGSEDLDGGLKAIYQVELDVPLTNERDNHIANDEANSAIKMRNSYVGLKGGFGTFLVGRHDTPLKTSTAKLELFDDTVADYKGTVGFEDLRFDSTILYVSPDFAGFKFTGAIMPGGGSVLSMNNNPSANNNADGLTEGYSLSTIYENGPWFGSLAYESRGSEFGRTSTNVTPEDFKLWRVGLGIRDWMGLTLSGIYEKWTDFEFREDNEADLWQIQAGYTMGNSMLKAMYGQQDRDKTDTEDRTTWAIGIDHDFTKRTKAYALYTEVDYDMRNREANDWQGFSLGMIHKF